MKKKWDTTQTIDVDINRNKQRYQEVTQNTVSCFGKQLQLHAYLEIVYSFCMSNERRRIKEDNTVQEESPTATDQAC